MSDEFDTIRKVLGKSPRQLGGPLSAADKIRIKRLKAKQEADKQAIVDRKLYDNYAHIDEDNIYRFLKFDDC